MATPLKMVQIVASEDVLNGKPRLEGRRITVQQIVEYHLYADWSLEKLENTLNLRPAEIHAALAYYYDHQDEIDQAIKNTEIEFERAAQATEADLDILDRYLSTKQAAARLGVSERRVRQLCEEGTLVARKIGINWFILPASLNAEAVQNRKPGRPRK
jgi:excisionase family DNA binding protein